MSKKALLIGINYRGTNNELRGCINDIISMNEFLVNEAGYLQEDIIMLSEDSVILPTKDNIIKNMYSVALNTHKEKVESLFIHYSGHGTWMRDDNKDELDGRDEAICPLDCDKVGMIRDDMLNNILSSINSSTKAIVIMDCCHSGSILDLKYNYTNKNLNKIDSKMDKIKADVIMISGCMDKQTSADAWNINGSNKSEGALTTNLLAVLKEYKYDITCYKLLDVLYKKLKDQNFDQLPQISCTKKLSQTTIFSYNKTNPMTSYIKCISKKRKRVE